MGEKKTDPIEKIAAFIVDKRNLFFLLYIFAAIFSIFSTGWVQVENDITAYLPPASETRRGLTRMDEEFTTYGTATVMVSNLSYQRALDLQAALAGIGGVSEAAFDGSADHYQNSAALYNITFDGEADDPVSVAAMRQVDEALADYDAYVETEVGKDDAAALQKEMTGIVAVAFLIIVLVLVLTSRSYAEIPVLLLTFGAAALLNMGTNFLCGTISFISNSVTVVLQLALAIDYAIILCHRFSDEHEALSAREACIAALSKAIPEISSSSLTTISGLAALGFMEFGIGLDMATVLIKAIIFSLLSVFTLMPGLLMLFSPLIDRTRHKKLIPPITALGRFDVKTRFVIPPIFAVVIVIAAVLANLCPYCYSFTDLTTPKQSESQITHQKIKENFGLQNMVAVLVPAGNYTAEEALLNKLQTYDAVKSTTGLATVEAMDGYVLTDALTPREFSELAGLDYEVAQLLYSAYAVQDSQYGELVKGLEYYRVPLFDMFLFLKDEMAENHLQLSGETQETLDDLFGQLEKAKLQLQSGDYSRMILYLTLPEESEETFDFLNTIHREAEQYYPADEVLVVGNSTSNYDLSTSFVRDNIIISVLSALFVILILLFTFKSAGLPVLLILVIQGSIWINFSFPYLQKEPLYFLSYLIVNAIQMGANIDYAIVISSHYSELKQRLTPKEAMVETLNASFPTIFTSGSILASAGTLIGFMTTNPVISAIGSCLGRGTVISMVLVLGVLPQILLLGDAIVEKTSFQLNRFALPNRSAAGTVRIRGHVRGYVHGVIDAQINGTLNGEITATILSGDLESDPSELPELSAAQKPEPAASGKGGPSDATV